MSNRKGVELFRWRAKNLLDATSMREPEKIPVSLEVLTWPYRYAGTTLKDVIDDPVKNAEAYCRYMADYEYDFALGAGNYVPYDAFLAVGSEGYKLHTDNTTVQHTQANQHFITDEEYKILINDYSYFANEYFPKKTVPAFKKSKREAYEMMKKSAECIVRHEKMLDIASRKAVFEHQIIPVAVPAPIPTEEDEARVRAQGYASVKEAYNFRPFTKMFYAPIDLLFDSYRGMMDTFEDLMNNEEVLEKACETILNRPDPMPPMPLDFDYTQAPLPFGAGVYHIAAFLNPEQYDKYWFREFKRQMLPYAEKGLKIFIKGEGAFLHIIDRFKEFPTGTIIIQMDLDDPVEAKKHLAGSQTVYGGLIPAQLFHYHKDKVFDRVKKIIDECAPGGGFLFNVPCGFPTDVEPEVAMEVLNFVNEYGTKK